MNMTGQSSHKIDVKHGFSKMFHVKHKIIKKVSEVIPIYIINTIAYIHLIYKTYNTLLYRHSKLTMFIKIK